MHRKPDWEDQLHLYLESVAEKPHAYGHHDCMLFAAGCVKAATGTDPGRRHRGRYATAAGAARYLKQRGFASPEAMIDALLPGRPVAFARRGDIVLVEGVPGICWGEYGLFVGQTPERLGLVREPSSAFEKAWSVGA